MLLKIILGDFSGDGHSITETRYVELSKDVSPDVLYDNYHRNVGLIGFSMDDIGSEYEEPYATVEQWEVLTEHGVNIPDIAAPSEDGVLLRRSDYVALTMFFYLNGFDEDIVWEEYEVLAVPLNGFYGLEPRGAQTIGYGIFF